MRTLKVAVFLFSLSLLCGHVGVYAQTQTGTVSGTVADASGAPVPEAKIALKNSETGQAREVLANDQGVFYFDKVLPGNYTLTITKGGFRTFQVTNLEVFVGKGTDIGAAKMEVGSLSETVVVEAGAAPIMETQSAQITGTFSAKEVQTLRIGLGGLDNIALLTPGVTPGFGNVNRNGVQVASNGQRSRSTQFMLDGHQMNDITIGGPSYFVNNFDMVAEYQVVTNQFSAEYGRNLGATVNIITKSGTNSFHGQAYWAHNNSALDARTSLQTKNNIFVKPKLINNVWGVNVGGPVLHDKVFFYFGYRGRKQPGSSSAIGTSSFKALTDNGVNTLLAAFPNSNTLKIYKARGPFAIKDGNPQCVGTPALSTFAGVANVENCPVQRVVPSTLDYYEYDGKVDYIRNRHTFMARYMIQNTNECCTVSNNLGEDGYWVATPNRNQSLGLTYTFQITPSQINYFRFAYGRFLVSFEGANTQPISNVQANLTNFSMPSGFLNFGLATNLPQNRLLNNFQFQDNWSLNRGRHLLKAGVEIQRNRTKLFFLPFINGSFSFTSASLTDFVKNAPATVSFAAGNGSFSPFETDQFYYFQDDFRVKPNFTLNLGIRYENNGQPINRAVDEILAREKDPAKAFWLQSVPLDQRTLPRQPNDNNNWAPRIGFAYTPRFAQWLFGQDKTVFRGGYGIAYELAFYNILLNMTTAAPRVFLFSLTSAAGTAIPVPGNGLGSDVAGVIPVPRNTIDPRTLAQTRLSPNFHNPYSQSWSFGFQREISKSQVLEVRYVGTNGIGLFQSVNANPLFSTLAAASTLIPRPFGPPPPGQPCPAGGTFGGGPNCATVTMAGFPQVIPSNVTPCSTAGATGFGRVDCTRAAERDRVNGAHSVYHSLQTRYDVRNWKNQFTGGASYTWSRAIDNVSEIFNFFNSGSVSFSENPFGTTSSERGVSNFDLTHTLVLHYIWELPWYRSQHGLLGRVLGGWQFSGTTTFYSGRPFTPIQRTGNRYCGQDSAFNNTFVALLATCRPFLANPNAPLLFTSGSTTVPNVGYVDFNGVIHRATTAGNPSLTDPVVSLQDVRFLFNDDNAIRFITNSPFGIGRNILRGPGTQNWDMAIDKRFRITERFDLRYRMSLINAFNHRIWDVPQPRVDLATFGDFTQNNVGPNIQNADHPLPGGRSIRMGLWVEF